MQRRISLVASILIPILLTFAVSAEAKQSPRRGTVIDASTGAPLAGANVVGGGEATIADQDGHFALNVAANDTITITFIGYEPVVIGETQTSLPLMVRMHQIALEVAEIVVTGGLFEVRLDEVAASVTVIGREDLQAAGSHHLQDLTQSIPNLTYAGGTSRPRYFQIRGIGERSHYAGQGPPSFSVGFVMDDVDLSGMGMAGLVHDIDQVEVFKGPQSTIFGPNAMAGLINMQSSDPTQTLNRSGSLSAGNDGLLRYAGHLNVPLQDNLAVRLSYTSGRSDGFRDNVFLGVDDTNRRREDMVRAKLRWIDPHNGASLLATLFRANLDNGYDAWTPDNNEELLTYSDNPGKDRQETVAFSLRGQMPLRRIRADLVSITAYSQTELGHSFDGDWGNDDFWLQAPYGFDPAKQGYSWDFFDRNVRERSTLSQEMRLLKRGIAGVGDVIVGAYAKSLEERDEANGYLFGGDATDLRSTFEVTDLAFYGQLDRALADDLTLSLNARVDRNGTSYDGTTFNSFSAAEPQQVDFDVTQWLAGGKLALLYRLETGRTAFAAVSRGFRAGGFNQHPLADDNRSFDPEHIWNLEAGYRLSGARASTAVTLFHALRSDQQVSLSSQQNPDDPTTFFYFTANAIEGRNSGLELEQAYRPTSAVRLFGSLGYLRTHIDQYRLTAEGLLELKDRAAAHAPEYNLRIGGEYRDRRGLVAKTEVAAVDGFFFSDSHDQRSDAYRLLSGSVGYRGSAWDLTLWGRNLLDERYAVRGFFFKLTPTDVEDARYISHGDPRQFGVTVKTSFFDTAGT